MSKQCLDVQQMQHLQELGLELDYNTMLSWIIDERGKDKPLLYISSEAVDYVDFCHYCLPAYTLQDVLDALPKEIAPTTKRYWLRVDLAYKCIYYYYDDYNFVEHRKKIFSYDGKDGLIDAAYSMLCWAIENKFVETNKNK